MLRPEQIELRVRHRLDRARAGEHVEDSSIELKDQWPDPPKAARRLAAHANAARLEPIIWVIGAREDGTLTGASKEDLAAVWAAIEAHFEGRFAPEMYRSDLISYESSTVLAVTWFTERAPYVVGQGDACEVLWRDGTRTRSAKRHELLRMLAPTSELPECNPFHLHFTPDEQGAWRVGLGVEIVPPAESTALLERAARLRVVLDGVELVARGPMGMGQRVPGQKDNACQWTSGGVVVTGPALLDLAQRFVAPTDLRDVGRASAEATVRVARSERPLIIRGEFERAGPRSDDELLSVGMSLVAE